MSDFPTRPDSRRRIKSMSWLESVFGLNSTKMIMVFMMFVITLIALMAYEFNRSEPNETIETGLLSILTGLLGFFIGQKVE